MLVVIDRFEGEFAVCELQDKSMIDIKKEQIPDSAHEGDVLKIENGKITLDKKTTDKIQKEIQELTEDLWE